jgi:serine protease Do
VTVPRTALPAVLFCLFAGCKADRADVGLLSTTQAAAQPAAELQQPPAAAPREASAEQPAIAAGRRTAIVEATTRISPAVVSINVTSRRRSAARSPWDLFFVPEGNEQRVQGYGTGFIIRSDGAIVTNQHVVAGAERIVVTLFDGTDVAAKLVGEDPTTDIALLKIDRTGLPTAPLGRSNDLMIGEWVVALGNPYAYLLGDAEPTVTVGVVSATGRDIVPSGEQPSLYLDMIQTDAAINPGNSGGPLVNAVGEVVGVNSSIFSSSGGSVGLGFAIPIERAIRVADEIGRSGSVRRAWTGLDVEGAAAMRESKSQGGVTVTAVAPGGPAARAGIRRGDLLTEANGRALRNYLDWEAVKLDTHVGDPVEVKVRSGGSSAARRIVTGDLPTVTAEKVTVLRDLQLITVDGAIRSERSLRSQTGALIFRASPEVTRATGLVAGDVIVAVNNSRVRDASQVADFLRALRPREPFRLYFERGGQILYTDLSF